MIRSKVILNALGSIASSMFLRVRGAIAATKFKQIGYDERVRLAMLVGTGLGVRAIARELGEAISLDGYLARSQQIAKERV